MNDYKKISVLCCDLHEAIDKRDAEQMATAFEALDLAYQDEFGDRLESFDATRAFLEMQYAGTRYLAYNNFYDAARRNCQDVAQRFEGIVHHSPYSAQQKEELRRYAGQISVILKALPARHTNLTIPRMDTRCCLCRKFPANKTGSHMVPNFLAHPTFSWDGKGKRFREALDHTFLNGPEYNGSYYGPEVPPERIEKTLGHEVTEEDIDKNVNRLEYDNEFCSVCEKRFGVLETAYAAYYNRQKKSLSPRLSYLFWLSVLWRMSLGRMGIFMTTEEEFSLWEILNSNMQDTEQEITGNDTDLGHWQYAIFRAEGLREGDKGILGCRIEHAPYVVMYNDLVMVFYPMQPEDKDLQIGPITIDREQLNSWRQQEKHVTVDRRFYWDVRDWIVESSYACYDPAREESLLLVREQERSKGIILSEEGKDLLIKANRLSSPPKQKLRKLHKFDRIGMAYLRTQEARKNGRTYDPLQDEELFLTQKDFHMYYEDLAMLSRIGECPGITKMPYYKEAKAAIPDDDQWYPACEDESSDPRYMETMEWFFDQVLAQENDSMLSERDIPTGNMKIGRNAPCPCGSGKKYKKCCGRQR